jgi:hypothetical protein
LGALIVLNDSVLFIKPLDGLEELALLGEGNEVYNSFFQR